jgi:hypothetical protein
MPIKHRNNAMANRKQRGKNTPEAQHARFVETAKEAGADERPEAMDIAIKKLSIRRPAPNSRQKPSKP